MKKEHFTFSERVELAMSYANGQARSFNQTDLARAVKLHRESITGKKCNVKAQTIQTIITRGSRSSSYVDDIASVCGLSRDWLKNESVDVLDGAESDHAIIKMIRVRSGYKPNTVQLPTVQASGTSVRVNPQDFAGIEGLPELIRNYLTMSPKSQKALRQLAETLHDVEHKG